LPIRLNKFLAQAGVASRRAADALIGGGRVSVNGAAAQVGTMVDPSHDDVRVSGKRIVQPDVPHLTIVLHKPAGVFTTMSDERGRRSVADLLPRGRRLFPVGRLDAESTGVLLCTSDGALAQALLHPSHEVEKRYKVTVESEPKPASLTRLGATPPRRNANGTYTFFVTLREGKNRQVRRMCANEGLRVVALARVSFGPIAIGVVKPGKWRPLTAAERTALDKLRVWSAPLGRAGGP
jgi:23S rRNA pseudouridine2605 synthase